MIKSTVCYLIRDGKWLMLLRNKKQHDLNYGKWIGIGESLRKMKHHMNAWYVKLRKKQGI